MIIYEIISYIIIKYNRIYEKQKKKASRSLPFVCLVCEKCFCVVVSCLNLCGVEALAVNLNVNNCAICCGERSASHVITDGDCVYISSIAVIYNINLSGG